MLSLYKVFSSHAVLQRERPIVFSGHGACALASVKAQFAGCEATAQAAEDGTWSVTFPSMAAGGPYELVVSDGSQSVTLSDLLVGEVWLCSGQSNMEMPMNSEGPFWRTKNADAECAAANFPAIRLFDFTNLRRMSPEAVIDDVHAGEWKTCTPENVRSFSACAYFFGRKLHQDLGIPIGLISTSWGGTDINAWISHDQFVRNHWLEYTEYKYTLPEEAKADEENVRKLWSNGIGPLVSWCDKFDEACGECPAEWLGEELPDESSWALCNGDANVAALPRPGRYAVRAVIEVPAEAAGREMTLQGMVANDCDRTFVNGVEIGSTGVGTPDYWSSVRTYAIKAGVLHAGRNILTVVVDDHLGIGEVNLASLRITGGGGIAAAVVPGSLMVKTVSTLPADFCHRPDPPFNLMITKESANYPCTLYNAMLYCFRRYAIRGMIWYQGCNNNGTQAYYKQHKMLIEGVRELWRDCEMPFIIVQLASFEQHSPETPLSDALFEKLPDTMPYYVPYAVTREIQAAVRDRMRNVGMACIFDAGNHSDIHPRDKQTVGARLALWAEAHTYGMDVKAEGPRFAGWRREGKSARIFLDYAEGLTTTDGQPPKGFAVVSRNGVIVPADAVIDGRTIVVSAPVCSEFEAVRYAFMGFCNVNLVNGAGLPAEPFRSDAIDYERAFR